MTVTITEIAKAAGVSLSSVSRALNNSDHPMNMETRQHILRVANELGYQPNLLARSLRTDRTYTIGIIVENIQSPFIPPIIRGIQDFLKPAGYFSTIINSDWDPHIEADSIQSLNNRQIDGIIFVETWHRSSNAVQKMTGKPFVFVHRLFNARCPNSVFPDDYGGARLVTNHLIRLGHHRIAFINGPKDWDASRNRLRGYQDELLASSINIEPRMVKTGDWEVKGGYLAAQKLVKLKKLPTAIFAANDLMALGAVYAIQDAGLHIPQGVAVVGYDNRNFTGFVRPAITTVTLPCYEMGEASAKLLLDLINDGVKENEPIEVKGELIVRESCGANPGKWQFEDDKGSSAWREKRKDILRRWSESRSRAATNDGTCL
ncbi:MAG: LacI family transcriptional regulator [Chloroflexi bacterium]|nr:LacI family transcriptional regulator [Chloroflexota bacterium]